MGAQPGSRFTCATVDRIDAMSVAAFPGLARPAGVYQTRGWMEASERMASGPVRYVVARDEHGRLAGLLPLYLVPRSDRGSFYHPGDSLGDDAPLLAAAGDPVALLGARAGYLTGWSIATDRTDAEATTLVALLFTEGCRVAAALGAALVTMQFMPRDQAALLVASGAVDRDELVLQRPQARIAVPPGGFDAYLDALSAARRSIVRRDLRQYARSRCVTSWMRLSEAVDFAPDLLARVQDRHARPIDPAQIRRMLTAQALSLDALSLVVASYRDGRPIAYSLSYVEGDTVYVRLAGLDHAAAEGTGAYFTTTFYEPIRHACERGARWVVLGIGSMRPKLLRGALLEPLFGVFRRSDGSRITPTERDRAAQRVLAQVRAELGSLLPSDFDGRL